MNLGISFDKIVLILVIAGLLIGPEKLPQYAEALGRMVKRAREFAQGAQTRVREEMGPEFDDVDWRKLDPRQYDPRRIIREALLDDEAPAPAPVAERIIQPPRPNGPLVREHFTVADPPPFDLEAT
ncbi:twin-arginine translocase TatA/TatE family subunit [Microbacterium stercoris]|uniref:Twin-arginine translocase TatA/TatE family subunit n=1 Tax=Microbacterium stercoris TaxID=2820289 RepID=A0A939QHT7_9MICO|nr:twin-arginine translocase TatA/TatE family subunit [Microbacterium stercoris]MBO3662315.1 twin-arginine translocase TatA/TatE family subunit [Microbacterium stercoris]MBO3664307.1 twin-arginine translocase TatA/TatE family subunit [Microbacterium stercoris]